MDNHDKSLDDVFDITPSEEPAKLAKRAKKALIEPDRSVDKDKDYIYARSQLYDIVERMQESLAGAMEVAEQSEHPRAYEVVFNGARHTADIVEKLADLQKKMNDLDKEDPKPVSSGPQVQNNMFVGSTAELMKMLKENQ